MTQTKISEININIWNKHTVKFAAHSDVNIIMGLNGSGKTTLLENLYKQLTTQADKENIVYMPSVDNISMRDKRRTANALTQDLEYYVFDMKTGPSLMQLRMSMIDMAQADQMTQKAKINQFIDVVNGLFECTGKHVVLDGANLYFNTQSGNFPIDKLSSGEKQLLLTLLRVFLLNKRESVVLIDEPENSLDTEWQFRLVDTLVQINPNAQLFITTHSPAIFGKGWGDKVWYMEDITNKEMSAK